MDQTIHTTYRDAAERRFSVLSRTKGRTAPGRRTRITDAVYRDNDAFSRGVFEYADSYLRARRELIPEWCRIKVEQMLREDNGAVIYTCPELAAENDMFSLVESGVNSGGSLTRGCICCARNSMYNMRTALDMKNYFDDAANGWKARTQTMWKWVYGFRRGVGPAKVK